jgi:hypothetical protein
MLLYLIAGTSNGAGGLVRYALKLLSSFATDDVDYPRAERFR